MDSKKQREGGALSSFECSSCGSNFPAESVGKKDSQGQPLCIPCSLKVTSATATTTSKEEIQEQQARVEATREKREKEKGSRRLVAALLLFAIPIIGLEMFLLLRNRPVEMTANDVAAIELSECMILMTVLGQYYDEHGRYPADLDSLVPEFWAATEASELQRFQYTPIGVENFRLERSDSVLPSPLISRALDNDLLPATMTAETDMDSYYDRIDED